MGRGKIGEASVDGSISRRELSALIGALGGAAGIATLGACADRASPARVPVRAPGGAIKNLFWTDAVAPVVPGQSVLRSLGPPGDDASSALPLAAVGGFGSPGDGGGGLFRWSPSPGVDDGGTFIIPSSDGGSALGHTGPGWQRVQEGPTDVRWFGAIPSGLRSDAARNSVAVQNAYASVVAKKGGTLYFPAGSGSYVLDRPLILSDRCGVSLIGDGWGTKSTAQFGHDHWPSGSVTGSVLEWAVPANALQATPSAFVGDGLVVRDLAIVGPGAPGTYAGLRTDNVVRCRFDNVLFANFPTGVSIGAQDCAFHAVSLIGCTVGLHIRDATDSRFYDLVAAGCGTGVLIVGGAGLQFVGGVIQGNGTGIHLFPEIKCSPTNICFNGTWLEANQAPIWFDSSNYDRSTGLLEFISFIGIRNGGGALKWTASHETGASVVQLSFIACDFAIPLSIPAHVSNAVLVNNRWSVPFSDAGIGTQRFAENVSGETRCATSLTGVTGVSTSLVAARNLAGELTLRGGSGAVGTHTFPVPEIDDHFELLLTPKAHSPGAAARSWQVKSYSGSPAGFSVATEADPGPGQSVTLSWLLVRKP